VNEPDDRSQLADTLAREFLRTSWTAELIAESGAACLGRWPAWMPALAQRVLAVHRTAPLDRPWELHQLILGYIDEHWLVVSGEVPPRQLPPQPRGRGPSRFAMLIGLGVIEIGSVGALAARLELSDGQLDWLADVRGMERTTQRERLRNYRYLTLPRRGGMPRVIEAPKQRLKEIQRWILREILDAVPAHQSAHGFTSDRSAVSHAELHTGQRVVLRLDLNDFFASVTAARIYGIWRTLGYHRRVAHMLTGLTTNTVPAVVWQRVAEATPAYGVESRFWLERQLATPHLPQGAPTSPALANLAAFRLDRRLGGLAQSGGLRYSRYADDLTFSGPARLIRRREQFVAIAGAIIREEGFRLNEAKSVTQTSGGRQAVCGIVVNVRTNVRRGEYDQLKAILHNAARNGPGSQNRDQLGDFRAHLLGRISWVESLNPVRARRLRELFAAIDWS
jgi:hypothetical protein